MNRGFSLIEVVIAAAIMAATLAMVIATLVMMKGSAFSASNRLDALNEGRDRMERLMALSYAHTSLNVGVHSFVSDSGSFTGSYTVATNSDFPGLKDISLTIYWKNPGATRVSSNTITGAVSEALH